MNNIRAEIIVTGKVQGVGYRWFVFTHANNLCLKGTVKNNINSTVEVIAEGDKDGIDKLILFLKKGPSNSLIKNVNVEIKNSTNLFTNFKII